MLGTVLLVVLSAMPAAIDGSGDARLNDLFFADARHGWAVGDRGVIWHTDDGGRDWRRQTSGVEGSLRAVFFLGEKTGWAAGGFSRPYAHDGVGLLLVTHDGGDTWTPVPRLSLPPLRRGAFFDRRHGWALTCRSAMYPSGVFVTDDGGESWRPLPGVSGSGWSAADFLFSRADRAAVGALAGRNGSLGVFHAGQVETVPSGDFDPRGLHQIRLMPPGLGWLVGDGGLVRQTADLGATWRAPPGELPLAARYFDFRAVAVRGQQCWIVGGPGTRVFHSADAGRTWNAFDTGVVAPLRAMAFADDDHGWAAGELGTILATDDGGRTWRQQRSGGARVALLGVFGEPSDVPLELFVRLSGSESYLSAVDVVGRRDVETTPREDVPIDDRLQEAFVGVGGCAASVAWRFPLRQPGLPMDAARTLETWDRANEGRGVEELVGHVVRQIRMWRPEVLVSQDPGRAADDPLGALVERAVADAVRRAADANAFPGQIVEAGLKPWRVKRVFAALPPGARGANDLNASQFAPVFGRSLAEAAADARALLEDRLSPTRTTLGFCFVAGDASDPTSPASENERRDFFAGLTLTPGGEARRPLPQIALDGRENQQRIDRKRRHVQAILTQAGRAGWSAEQLLAQMDPLTRDLDPASAGQILYQLGDQCYRGGRWPAAAETFRAMATRYPNHPLAPSALVWLVQYYASAEAACRLRCDAGTKQKRFEQAVAIGQELERGRPERFVEPIARFPLGAAFRGLGQPRQADRFYQMQTRDDGHDAWWTCAQGELRQIDAKSRPVRPMLRCVKTAERPHLDGRFDDAAWRQVKPVALKSAQGDDDRWPATVMAAHDDEYLYFAIRCREPPGAAAAPTDDAPRPPRPRDGDLTAHDRVEMFFDTDRDYATFDRLAIDDRGWTNDECWGDATWNPRWFVAASRDAGEWTAEAAIPLAELVDHPPQPREAWAVGLQRIVPGVGFQSWTTPAAVRVLPDGFGYLVFE